MRREVYWLWCVMVFGVANKRLWDVSGGYDHVEDFVDAVRKHEVVGADERVYANARRLSLENALEQLEYAEELGQRCVCFDDDDYPAELRLIADPPAVLFTMGDISLLSGRCILDITGTRMPSEYSVSVADRLCRELAGRGLLLASGFAEGIDRMVNEVSLETGSVPVAVTASPLEYSRDEEETLLKKRIAAKGVLISEQIPGRKPDISRFVQRNRISVGISKGLVFIEARADSKGLNNYQHAFDQGKPVFVVPPHDIFDSRYFGQADLLRNECRALFSADDVVHELAQGGYYDFGFVKGPAGYNLPAQDSDILRRGETEKPKRTRKAKTVKEEPAKTQPEKGTGAELDLSRLSETQEVICMVLREGEKLADEVAFTLEMDISEVLKELTMLELDGVVERMEGHRFRLR